MIPLALGLQGAMGIASGIIGHKKRKQEQKTAQAEFESYACTIYEPRSF